MVRGRTTAPKGLILGHEITGEVIEKGRDVEQLEIGDLVTVPFNVACGRCRMCREQVIAMKLEDARRIIAAAEKKATELGQPMNVAVADAGGNLVAHVRMDGAWIGSVDIAIKKAWTARAFDVATRDLAELSQPGKPFFGIHASNDGRVMVFAGGVPLRREGRVVGAIGVSGGSGEQDQAVAEAGAGTF